MGDIPQRGIMIIEITPLGGIPPIMGELLSSKSPLRGEFPPEGGNPHGGNPPQRGIMVIKILSSFCQAAGRRGTNERTDAFCDSAPYIY